MKVSELILHLTHYAAQSPENGAAEVVLAHAGTDSCFGIAGANDARGIVPGEHMLIIVPDEAHHIGVKRFKRQ